jgi:hypothetical protein
VTAERGKVGRNIGNAKRKTEIKNKKLLREHVRWSIFSNNGDDTYDDGNNLF